MTTKFFIPLKNIPTVTAQEKGEKVVKGKIIHYDKPEVADAKRLFLAHLSQHKPSEPIPKGVPVGLGITFYYPWNGGDKDAQWRVEKPDVDNAVKLFIDCMTKTGFWADDKQIASLTVEKLNVNIDKGVLPGIAVLYDVLP